MNEPIYINKGRIGQYLYKTAFVNQIKSLVPHTLDFRLAVYRNP